MAAAKTHRHSSGTCARRSGTSSCVSVAGTFFGMRRRSTSAAGFAPRHTPALNARA